MDGMRKPNALAAGFYLLTHLVTGIFWFTLTFVLTVVGLATSVHGPAEGGARSTT